MLLQQLHRHSVSVDFLHAREFPTDALETAPTCVAVLEVVRLPDGSFQFRDDQEADMAEAIRGLHAIEFFGELKHERKWLKAKVF